MARNMLKCILTGSERITNKSYLKKRLDRLGITEEEFRKHYISKVCAQNLASAVESDGLRRVSLSMSAAQGPSYTVEDVHKMLLYNGKNKLVLAQALKQLESNTPDINENTEGEGVRVFVPLTTYTTSYTGEGAGSE